MDACTPVWMNAKSEDRIYAPSGLVRIHGLSREMYDQSLCKFNEQVQNTGTVSARHNSMTMTV
jgi:hypothetical protein